MFYNSQGSRRTYRIHPSRIIKNSHMGWPGGHKKGPSGQSRVEYISAQAAKGLFAYANSKYSAYAYHPYRKAGRYIISQEKAG